jgi:hypothetical protein
MKTLLLLAAALPAFAWPVSIFAPPPPDSGRLCQQHTVTICDQHRCQPVIVCD